MNKFEISFDNIDKSRINKKINIDIAVLGAGAAGISTAYAASKEGAKVVVIEKMETYAARGFCNAAIGTKLQKQNGIELDKEKIISELVSHAGNRVHQQLIKLWADRSGEIFDHYIDICEANDVDVVLTDPYNISDLYPTYATSHVFAEKGGERSTGGENIETEYVLLRILEKAAKENGAEFHYNTKAVQLVCDSSGKVNGVIAESEKGYMQYNVKNGVVLATGGYGENQDMVDAWCPTANFAEMKAYTPVGGNTGDGIRMALQLGASLQNLPHPIMVHTIPGYSTETMTANQSFLHVNRLGLRYENECLPNQSGVNGRFIQPGRKAWAILDSGYEKDHATFKSGFDGPISEPVSELEISVKNKMAFKADTIKGMAELIGVPADVLERTVARYTGFAYKKKDEDFGKDPKLMFPIDRPPFYAIPLISQFMVTVGGLNINPKLQVLDMENEVIAGLYAVGNVAGNFFAVEYPLHCPGLSHGRALTLGYALGQALAKGKSVL